MEAVTTLEHRAPAVEPGESPLTRARLHRKLTAEEVAKRAAIREDEVRWLEEGRVYRFPSADHALTAMLLYASALGIGHDEALALAGRRVAPRPLRRSGWTRVAALAAAAVVAAALAAMFSLAGGHDAKQASAAAAAGEALPAPWTVDVVVLNGSGDINYTRQVASRIGALGYRLAHVGRAARFDYRQTSVYFPPGGEPLALRLAQTLGVTTSPLPGGDDPRRLVVIVGPARGPGE